MAGGWRRRRRRRVAITNVATTVVIAVAVAVVVVIAVTAVSQIGPTSGPYRRTVDRSFATLAAPLTEQSNAGAAALTALLTRGPVLPRRTFFMQLDALAGDTSAVEHQFDALSPPAPTGSAAKQCAAALGGRARAAASLRSALESLLGGRQGLSGGDEASATAAMTVGGGELTAADASWVRCRHALRHGPGSARLPASRWINDTERWSPGAIDDFVTALVASPSLAAVRAVSIVATTTAPPTVVGGTGTGVVVPTKTLSLHVVVADNGNVAEDGVVVTAVLGTAAAPSSATANLTAGAAVSLSLPAFHVKAGSSYVVVVTASLVGPPTAGSRATTSFPVDISTNPPPPTTTAPPTTTTTTKPKTKSPA